jgi:putative ABC transport system substrate-binding protein
MKRRGFITLIGGAVFGWPLAATPVAAKPPEGKLFRIGVLGTAPWRPFEGLREGLQALGYLEGRNVSFEYRWNGGRNDLYPALAAELVAIPVDLLVVIALPAALAARNATSTIPILMCPVSDPVKSGLVPNMARPGGNLTGFSNLSSEVVLKRIELVQELVPGLSSIGLLANTSNPYAQFELENMRPAAAAAKISLDVVPAINDEQLDHALVTLARQRPGAVIAINDQYFLSRHVQIVKALNDSKLPSVFGYREFVDAGGLAYYGANYRLEFRRMAEYADRILNGTKPGELPVQAVTRFELVLNQRAAGALGMPLPPMLLARADEVIE